MLFILAGCGQKTEDVEGNVDKKTDQTTQTDSKSDDGNVTGDRQETKVGDNELGLTEGLPSNFPEDVPQPNNSKCIGSLNSSEGTVVTFESSDKVKDILNFYRDAMKKNGFELGEGGETLVSDQGGLIGWKKDSREVGLMIGYDDEKSKSSVVITYK